MRTVQCYTRGTPRVIWNREAKPDVYSDIADITRLPINKVVESLRGGDTIYTPTHYYLEYESMTNKHDTKENFSQDKVVSPAGSHGKSDTMYKIQTHQEYRAALFIEYQDGFVRGEASGYRKCENEKSMWWQVKGFIVGVASTVAFATGSFFVSFYLDFF